MKKIHRGYTLLEMIVSVGLFSLVMLAATAAYLTLIKTDRQTRAVNTLVTNLSFTVDSMSREIRTGTAYKCNATGTNCTGTPGTSFAFTDSNSPAQTVTYWLSNGQIMATINGITYPLTDPNVTITTLSFYVRGVGTGDGIQPQTIFTVRGTIPTEGGQTLGFSVEGAATQRSLDI